MALSTPQAFAHKTLEKVGTFVLNTVAALGQFCVFSLKTCLKTFKAPWRWRLFVEQADSVGIGSLFIVTLTSFFTGAVFTLQSMDALTRVGMESMVGSMVMVAVARELAPVLTTLMVVGRAGSAIATELGGMRVSEQIDALEVMAVDPIHYLVVPRVLATTFMLPFLCMLANIIAMIGTYVTAVSLMGVDEGSFWARIQWYVDPYDFIHGIIKSIVFGFFISLVSCMQGFYAQGGAKGVGQAATQAVVLSSIGIFLLDYILTSLLLPFAPK